MRKRMEEDMLESQADSYLDRILTGVNMLGSFFPLLEKPQSFSHSKPCPLLHHIPLPTSMVRVFQSSSKYHVQPGNSDENKESSSDKEKEIRISGKAAINSESDQHDQHDHLQHQCAG